MSTNYFFVSSPLHLLFSSNIALRHARDDNVVVLVPREARQFSPFAEVLSQDGSIFDEVISFEGNNLPGKFAERKRRMAVIRETLQRRPADRIHTGTDRRVEFQYAMSVATGIRPGVVGIYVDDGMASYLGHKSMNNIAHRYIDPLFKKLVYGRWWKNPMTIGASSWISEVHVAYPDLVHELLKSKKVVPIEKQTFKDPKFIDLCQRLLQFRDVDDRKLRDIDVIIVLTHESFYADADAHLDSLVKAVSQNDPTLRVAIKPHPRSDKAESYRAKYPEALFLDSKVSMELYLPLLKEQCVIIGDISSALFTANWFNDKTRVIAVSLTDAVPTHIEDNLVRLLQQLGIPKIGIDQLPEHLTNLRQ